MTSEQRVTVVATAVAIISKKNFGAVYSYELSGYTSVSVNKHGRNIEVYDYKRGCYMSANSTSGSEYSLYDYGVSAHLSLTINGNNFSGYDYGSSSHFSGSINAGSISLYDYQTSTYYNYSV